MEFVNKAYIHGTCYQGQIPATYRDLVDAFGMPTTGPDDFLDDKVTCSWHLTFEDGTVATIYDWKTGYTPTGVYNWHIGGKNKTAVERVLDVWNNRFVRT